MAKKRPKEVQAIFDYLNIHNFDVNFGLPPNSSGFTIVYQGEKNNYQRTAKKLYSMLNSLDSTKSEIFRKEYYGRN